MIQIKNSIKTYIGQSIYNQYNSLFEIYLGISPSQQSVSKYVLPVIHSSRAYLF